MRVLYKSIILIGFYLCSFTGTLSAYTERNLLQNKTSVSELKEILVTDQKWVPYPDYNDRQGWDDLLGKYKEEYIIRGEKALKHEWIVIRASDYLEYERSGSRTIMEEPFGKNNQAIIDLCLAELAEGKGRFVGKLIDGVYLSCEMTSWVLSAHLPHQLNKRTLPDHNDCVIDLSSGDLGSAMSWIYYFFQDEFDKVNPTISERLRYEIERRILETYMDVDRFWWMGFNYNPGDIVNNWNPWCNANVLQCFMLMENDIDKLAPAVYRTMRSVDVFLNYNKDDGACEEGPAYWAHAAGKLYDYLQVLYDVTDGRISLFDNSLIKKMGEYISRSYIGNDWVVNFADASARLKPDANLIYRYGKAVNSREMISFASYLLNSRKNEPAPDHGRDLYRTFQSLRFVKEASMLHDQYMTPSNTWYMETQFCYMKSDDFFLAVKGGHNNESHNHNDVGTFILAIDSIPVFVDAGVGTYTRQTFSSERYNIWTMQSVYHNLPEINGISQEHGSEFKAENVFFDPQKQLLGLNLEKAYGTESGDIAWRRTYQLKSQSLKIKDQFVINNPGIPNRIHFLTRGAVDITQAGVVQIEIDKIKVTLTYDRAGFTPSLEEIALKDSRLVKVWGEKLYRLTLTDKETRNKGVYEFSISGK